jgi:hypothetical protein
MYKPMDQVRRYGVAAHGTASTGNVSLRPSDYPWSCGARGERDVRLAVSQMSDGTRNVILAVLVVIAVLGLMVLLAQWLGRRISGDGRFPLVARCLDGHVFKTTFVPLFLLPVPRVGVVQFHYCPVGQHWTFVVLARQ